MTEPINRASPRNLFRKNTPSETRENWQFVKAKGAAQFRFILRLLIVALLIPAAAAFYFKGYFDGTVAARTETISTKEPHNVR